MSSTRQLASHQATLFGTILLLLSSQLPQEFPLEHIELLPKNNRNFTNGTAHHDSSSENLTYYFYPTKSSKTNQINLNTKVLYNPMVHEQGAPEDGNRSSLQLPARCKSGLQNILMKALQKTIIEPIGFTLAALAIEQWGKELKEFNLPKPSINQDKHPPKSLSRRWMSDLKKR